jgi:hypothetical protein
VNEAIHRTRSHSGFIGALGALLLLAVSLVSVADAVDQIVKDALVLIVGAVLLLSTRGRVGDPHLGPGMALACFAIAIAALNLLSC